MTKYLTIAETLEALRISRKTYYRMVEAGQLHPRTVSKRRQLIARSEIEAILSRTIK